MRLVQFVWWWDRWLCLRFVKWDSIFLWTSVVIGPLEIRIWRKEWTKERLYGDNDAG